MDSLRYSTRANSNIVVAAIKTPLILFGIALLALYMPFAVMGERAFFTVHDMLDGGVANRVAAARSGVYFSVDGTVSQIANGLPRASLPNALNASNALYLLLPPFVAFQTNYFFVHFAAFCGMYRFLRRDIVVVPVWISAGIAAVFASLPFYTTDSLSVAGIPWVAGAIIGLARCGWRASDVLILAAYPFVSSLPISGIYLLLCGILALLLLFAANRKFPWAVAGGIAIMAFCYFLAEYQLIYAILSNSLVSHRVEFNPEYTSYDFGMALKASLRQFIHGHEHAPSFHFPMAVIATLVAVTAAIRREMRTACAICAVLFIIAATSLIYGFQHHYIINLVRDAVPGLRQIQIGRFVQLQPFLWYTAGALALEGLQRVALKRVQIGSIVAPAALALSAAYAIASNHEIISTWRGALGDDRALHRNSARYAGWFAEPLFARIKEAIGSPVWSYRVASVGLPPDLAIYNGMYTLDFYCSNYPLDYKRLFRRIIARELEKSSRLKGYYDGWGSRCYIFSAELWHHAQTKDMGAVIQSLEIDLVAFRDLGGRYLLAGAKITNAGDIGLQLLGVYEDVESIWRVYLYDAGTSVIPGHNVMSSDASG